MEISIVIPVYRAEQIIDDLVSRLMGALKPMQVPFEIILVEDGGPDKSWDKIVYHAAKHSEIRGILLSRNFGQHHAITAGLDVSKGNWVVVMDCDLQDQPEEIAKLYNKAQEGYDIVFARRAQRQDSFVKRMSSKIFYGVFAYLSGIPQDNSIANFGIYSRKVINVINSMREPMRAFAPMARWVGFNRTAIDVEHAERFAGESSYNWSRLFNLALDFAMAYSDKPLKLTVKLGIGISILSVLYTIYNIVLYNMGVITLTGYTSLIVSIWFLSGLIIFTLGIIGLYIGKMFEGIKNRPLYIIDKTT
ncbi:MAG: glycosyltransferase family 2 protein [Bacteroidia bacterium]|nr:glycosyltransferase family 2 protein [Bacteroidia bacterium]